MSKWLFFSDKNSNVKLHLFISQSLAVSWTGILKPCAGGLTDKCPNYCCTCWAVRSKDRAGPWQVNFQPGSVESATRTSGLVWVIWPNLIIWGPKNINDYVNGLNLVSQLQNGTTDTWDLGEIKFNSRLLLLPSMQGKLLVWLCLAPESVDSSKQKLKT